MLKGLFPRRLIIHQNICAPNSRWYKDARMGVILQCMVKGPCRLNCIFLWVGEETSMCVCVCVCVLAQLTNWRNRWTPHSPYCEETQHLHTHTHTHLSEQHSTLNRICWHVYVGLFIHLIRILKQHLFQRAHYLTHCKNLFVFFMGENKVLSQRDYIYISIYINIWH